MLEILANHVGEKYEQLLVCMKVFIKKVYTTTDYGKVLLEPDWQN